MNRKAVARFVYANVPGAAPLRFALKDVATNFLAMPTFHGVFHAEIGLILDIGADRGQSTAAFRRLRPECEVIAFEPEVRAFCRVVERFRGDPKVSVRNFALGNENGHIRLYSPHYGFWNCDGMSATTRDEATLWLKNPDRMLAFNPSKLRVDEHIIECRTLDSFKLSPTLIKLHTQKSELDVLKGAEQTLRRSRPMLMCAFPTDEVVTWMESLGYSPFTYDGGFHPGVAPPAHTFTWFLITQKSEVL